MFETQTLSKSETTGFLGNLTGNIHSEIIHSVKLSKTQIPVVSDLDKLFQTRAKHVTVTEHTDIYIIFKPL